MTKTLTSILICLLSTLLLAQSPVVERLTIADGLSQGMIYDILQDKEGFLWFATRDGLNRYDGYRFEAFTNDPFDPFSISGNDIERFFEDSRGNLWLSVAGHGIDVLEKKTGKFLHFKSLEPGQAPITFICFDETPDGSVWVYSLNGLLRFRWKNAALDSPNLIENAAVEKVNIELESPIDPPTQLCAQTDGSLLLSTTKSIYRFEPTEGRFSKILASESVNSIYKTAHGRVWAMAGERVFVIENNAARAIDFRGARLNKAVGVKSDGMGNLIWAVQDAKTYHGTFYSESESDILRRGGTERPTEVLRMDTYSPSACIDRAGNLWAGTSGYGLWKTSLARQPFEHFFEGSSTYKPTIEQRLAPDGSQTSSLPKLPTGLKVFEVLFSRKSGNKYFICFDAARFYLLPEKLAQNGFGNLASWGFSSLSQSLYGVLHDEDAAGNLWLGGGGGKLYCYRTEDQKLENFDISKVLGAGYELYALHFDAEQNLWVGSDNGMARLKIAAPGTLKLTENAQPEASVFRTDPANPKSLRHNLVTSFCSDPQQPDRYLWVGTKGGGLNLLDKKTGDFQHFTSQNSDLPNDVVYGILPDERGNLWLSTNRGISQVIPSHPPSFRNFREFDGLQGDEFNTGAFGKASDDKLIFGGVNGLTEFYPSKIKERKTDGTVRLTGLKINNISVNHRSPGSPLQQPVFLAERVELQHSQNTVTLEFALLDFTNPQENRFRYRLLGVENDWVEAGASHSANYAQLRPGNYVFEVQGGIGGGVWSQNTARLRIHILPPWWATWWAYLLYAASVSGALYLFYALRLRRKLEHQEALRLQELDKFKTRFFTNITHEFRTPLTVILGMAERLSSSPTRANDEGSHALNLIQRNGENLLRLINQILDLAKLENNSLKINYVQGDVLAYLKYVSESLHSLANAQNLLLRVESEHPKIVMDYDPERLLQIVHNLLSNAIKFSPSGGQVILKAAADQNWLTISIADDGPGIPQEDQVRIFDRFFMAKNQEKASGIGSGIGLTLTQELVVALGGKIFFECPATGGTTFFVQLPISNLAPLEKFGQVQFQKTAEKLSAQPFLSTAQTNQTGAPPQLLLIEDNPDIIDYLSACLRDEYQLDFAFNGRSGIEKSLENIPDLIILDVMMPEKDGFEVCDFLKNDERTSHIPIILLTAKADVESRMAGLRRGADVYLTKPFHQEELLVQVHNLLEIRQKMRTRYGSTAKFEQETATTPLYSKPETQNPKLENLEDVFFKKFRAVLAANFADPDFSLDLICRELAMSRTQIYRKLMAITGRSAVEHIQQFRLERARVLLLAGGLNVSEVAFQTGFNDPKYFSRVFTEHFGQPPSELLGRV